MSTAKKFIIGVTLFFCYLFYVDSNWRNVVLMIVLGTIGYIYQDSNEKGDKINKLMEETLSKPIDVERR